MEVRKFNKVEDGYVYFEDYDGMVHIQNTKTILGLGWMTCTNVECDLDEEGHYGIDVGTARLLISRDTLIQLLIALGMRELVSSVPVYGKKKASMGVN